MQKMQTKNLKTQLKEVIEFDSKYLLSFTEASKDLNASITLKNIEYSKYCGSNGLSGFVLDKIGYLLGDDFELNSISHDTKMKSPEFKCIRALWFAKSKEFSFL